MENGGEACGSSSGLVDVVASSSSNDDRERDPVVATAFEGNQRPRQQQFNRRRQWSYQRPLSQQPGQHQREQQRQHWHEQQHLDQPRWRQQPHQHEKPRHQRQQHEQPRQQQREQPGQCEQLRQQQYQKQHEQSFDDRGEQLAGINPEFSGQQQLPKQFNEFQRFAEHPSTKEHARPKERQRRDDWEKQTRLPQQTLSARVDSAEGRARQPQAAVSATKEEKCLPNPINEVPSAFDFRNSSGGSASATVSNGIDEPPERSASSDREGQPHLTVKTFLRGSKRGSRTGYNSESRVTDGPGETQAKTDAFADSGALRTPVHCDMYQTLEFSAADDTARNAKPKYGNFKSRGGSTLQSPVQLMQAGNNSHATALPSDGCPSHVADVSEHTGGTFGRDNARPRQADHFSSGRRGAEVNARPAHRRGYNASPREYEYHGAGRSQNAFSKSGAAEVGPIPGGGDDRLTSKSADGRVRYGMAVGRDGVEPSSVGRAGGGIGPRTASSSVSSFSGAYAGEKSGRGSKWQQRTSRSEAASAEASESQLEMLVNQLWSNSLECMICCCIVRVDVAVWSCDSCYHVFHLYCIKKWAIAATTGSHNNASWQCPACREPHSSIPVHYDCFCGRLRDPPVNPRELPHSCGEVCHKKRKCPHACTRLCHPGPCPPCRAQSQQSCDCGKMQVIRNCNAAVPLKCDEACGKTRGCGRHVCLETCHRGACEPCAEHLEQVCHCLRRMTRLVPCTSVDPNTSAGMLTEFSCGLTCGRLLECGVHKCGRSCHSGPCPPCSRLPGAVTHCPCGRRQLIDLGAKPRTACTDPVPSCGEPCRKRLPCYVEADCKGEKHICRELCHDGACTPCQDETTLRCCCGSELMTVKCATLTNGDGSYKTPEYTCTRRCNAKMSCGRHKCNRQCCSRNAENSEEVHMCLQVCGRQLPCGMHRCDELCHRGPCRPCPHASFDELRCHCGAEVIFPPVPCGTAPPSCERPCQRQQSCSHPVSHNCHPDTEPCARCVELTKKWCMGQHELRTNIPCYLAEVSCGRSCGKLLPCGVHSCIRTCHKDDCSTDGKPCSQQCTRPRADCGHACGAPCHGTEPCPTSAPCLKLVELKCVCGVRSGKVPCGSFSAASGRFARTSAGMLAVKLSEANSSKAVNLEDEVFLLPEKDDSSAVPERARRRLKCDGECAVVERNRRLALALEIENPDLQAKLGVPAYSDFLRNFARREPAFVVQVEKVFNGLVMNSKQEKQRSPWLTYCFSPMKSERRRLIHELAAFYGCTTQSQDQEPNKSVVVSAMRQKCWLPSILLSVAVQKNITPRPPLPVPHDAVDEETVKARAKAAKSSLHAVAAADSDIDYFEITD